MTVSLCVRESSGPARKVCMRERGGVGLDHEPGRAVRPVALPGEAGVHTQHSHDRGGEPPARTGVVGAVRPAVPRRVGRRDPDEVGAWAGRLRRMPGEDVAAGPEVRLELVDRLRRADRARHLEVDERALAEPEPDLGCVAQPVAVGRDRRQARVVAAEGRAAAVAHAEVGDSRSGAVDPEWARGHHPAAVDEPDHVPALRHVCAAEAAVPAHGQEASPLGRDDPADAPTSLGGELNTDPCRRRQLGVDAQPLGRRREVTRRDRQIGRLSGRRECENERGEGEAAHGSRES